jgi:hypothetical protein
MKEYESPKLVTYGRIADNTFITPHGQLKGCLEHCHLDNFGEPSALSGS